LEEGDAYGLQLDETSDRQKKERLVIMVKIVRQRKILTRLLELYHVEELDAKGIFKKLKQAIKKWRIDIKKWEALNTDGASVMTGKLNGLVMLVQKEYPHVLHIHCLAQRLNLAVREPLYGPSKKKVGMKEYRELETKLKLTRKFLKSSTKSWGALRTLAKLFHDSKKKITGLHDIRWLSLHEGIDSFLGQLFSVLTDLAQVAEDPSTKTKARGAIARGLYKYWTKFTTLSFLCFLGDLTEETNILSKLIQTRNIDGHEVLRGINEVEDFLNDFEVRKPENEALMITGSKD